MKKLLVIVSCISLLTMPLMAQNFGRYPNGTSPDKVVIPSVSYSKNLDKSAKKDSDGSLSMQLADCYIYGLGIDKNEKKAIKLYKEIAEKFNNGEAMLMLADYYIQNEKVELAYNYYQKAANTEYAPVLVIYGSMLHLISSQKVIDQYRTNLGQEQQAMIQFNPQEMVKYYEKELTKAKAVYNELNRNKEDKTRIDPRYNRPVSYESDEHMAQRKAAENKVTELDALIRKYSNMSQTPQMKDSFDVHAQRINAIQYRINKEQDVQKRIKSILEYRINAINFVEENNNSYLDYYKRAADKNYPEGMYCYAYYAKDYEYMPIAAEVGNYSLYADLVEHYYTNILNNENVSNSYPLLKKYSDLAEQHNEKNQKELIAYIDGKTPEYLIAEIKNYFEANKRIQNDKLAAMNYALANATDTAKLNALLVQSILTRFNSKKKQIQDTLYSVLDRVSRTEKIKFCNDNVNNAYYTNIIYQCLNHIVNNDTERNTLGDAWYMLGEMAYNGKIAGISDRKQKEQKRDEYFAKAKSFGNRKAIDYATINELEEKYRFHHTFYNRLGSKKKNEFNRWDQEVVLSCQYWMLRGDTTACMDYAQALLDNHEGGFTHDFDSTIIDAYQRAIDKGSETALYKKKAYEYMFANGFGIQSVFDDIKVNGTPAEQIKFTKALIEMGDDGGRALNVLQLALDVDSPEAYYQLYKLCYEERVKNNDVHDPVKAFEAFEKAINLGMTDKIPELADAYIKGINGKGYDEHKAVCWIKKGHEMGITECTAQYAWCYARGLDNIKVDFDKAQELMKASGGSYDFFREKQQYELEQAANKNDIKAIHELISDYGYKAEGDEKYRLASDPVKYNSEYRRYQMKWIKKGVALGDAESLRQLGWAYYYGWAGLTVDKNKTLSYLKQAAAKKSSEANYNLGWCYEYGMDGFITPNRRVAAEYYRAAYNLGGSRDCERAWLRCIN